MSWRRPQSLDEPDPGASSHSSGRVLPSRFLPFGTFEALWFQDAPMSMWLVSRFPPCGDTRIPRFYFADHESPKAFFRSRSRIDPRNLSCVCCHISVHSDLSLKLGANAL